MSHLSDIEANLATLDTVKEAVRSGLLRIISECRRLSIRMPAQERERMINAIIENFDPDGLQSDHISDAFADVGSEWERESNAAESRIEMRHIRSVR